MEIADTKVGQAAIAGELRHALDAVLSRDANGICPGWISGGVLPVETDTCFVNQSRIEHMGVAEGESLDFEGLRPFVVRAAVRNPLKRRKAISGTVNPAVAPEYLIAVVEAVINTDVKRIRADLIYLGGYEVVLHSGLRGAGI